MKPVKHEHTVEVTIPESVNSLVEKTNAHIRENKKSYLFGLGGIVVGVVGTRLFSSSTPAVQVFVQTAE